MSNTFDTPLSGAGADPSGLSNNLNTVLNTAPELGKSPGLSVGVATTGGDVQGNSQALARGTQAISDSTAHASVATAVGGPDILQSALDWFGNHVVAPIGKDISPVVTDAEHLGSKALNVLNAPMRVVQHEYRYLHDVEARHGITAALLEGLGIAAGAAAGFVGTGSVYGAELGAEGATGLESQMFYKDSWDRTGQPSYADPNTHQQVSFGRDIVSELGRVIPGLQRSGPVFKLTSGLIDGAFDINVGGTELLGLAARANSAAGLGGTLGSYFPGKAPVTTEQFDNLLNSFSGGNVRRAFADIAAKSPGEIALTAAYRPIAQQTELLTALGNASTEAEVTNIFRNLVRTHEMVYFDKLPTLSITRLPFQVAHEAMGDTVISPLQRLYKNTSRLPDTYDEVAQHFTNHDFNPSSMDDGTVGVVRTALFTEDRSTAASIGTLYANAKDPAEKLKIWRNLTWSTLANMAGWRGSSMDEYLLQAFEDPSVRAMWKDALDKFISASMYGKGADYGRNDLGDGISQVRDTETGTSYAAGITMNQTGRIAYLDLRAARRAAAQLAGARDLFGKVDDFAFDRFTQPVFKRWVLMTPSYGLHIALAELIPNSLRLGLHNVVNARVEGMIAHAGVKVEADEANAVAGLVWKVYGGVVDRLPARMSQGLQDRIGYLTDWIVGNGGDMVHPALSSGHNYGAEIMPREEQSVSLLRRSYFDSPAKRLGDDFGLFGVGSDQHLTAWQARLRESAKDDASRIAAKRLAGGLRGGEDLETATTNANAAAAHFLRNMPETERGKMLRARPEITSFPEGVSRPPDMDQFDEWGRAVVAKVRGEVRGADRTVHLPLLDHIANGEITNDAELKAITATQRPMIVSGREMLPHGEAKLQNIANAGFRHVLNPLVNFMSRQPIAGAEYIKQRTFLQTLVDRGLMTDDEAHVQASAATVQNVIKNVHNLTDRTQWTVTLRNWAPFYFAQEQAYRRMGRLLAENPRAFRQYQLMISSMHDIGQVFSNSNGQGYFVSPGTGWMTGGVVAAASMLGVPVETATPVGMGWNLASSSVIFPLSAGFRPDIGPIISIPVAAVSDFFPETLSPVLKADLSAASSFVLGPSATTPLYEQLIPNTIAQRLLTAWWPGFNQRSFNSTFMQTLATLDYEHKIPPADANYLVQQEFMDRVRWQTRILYTAKALFGAITPVSPELTNTIFTQFSGEVAADIVKYKSVAAGLQAFISKHPDATPFTVWQSTEPSGSSFPSSTAAENWINQNYDLITRYPNAGILMLPTGLSTKYNAAVYNEQLAQGLRVKLAPSQWEQPGNQMTGYIQALYIAGGNSIFYKWLNQFEQQTAGLTGTMKYNASQAFWGDGQRGSGTVGKYGQQNPVWWQWFQSSSREVDRGAAIRQMTQLLKDNPAAARTPVGVAATTLLEGYRAYEGQVTTLTTDGSSGSLITAATNSWKQYLYGVAAAEPQYTNLITGLFLSIPSTTTPQVNISNTAQPGVFKAAAWNKAA